MSTPISARPSTPVMVPLDGAPEPEPLPLLQWLTLLLRHSRGLLLAGLIGGLLLGLFKIQKPRVFTSSASAVLEGRKQPTTISAISAQLGLSTLGNDGASSPMFYADLATSHLILGAAVDSTYTFRTAGGEVRGNLVSIFHVSGPDKQVAREKAIGILRRMTSATVVPKTGVLRVSVTTTEPALGPLIVNQIIDEINRVNIASRQSQASGERSFTGRRVAEAAEELRSAENALQFFLQQNRDYRSSPRLMFEQDRLSRTVTMRQAIYTSVAQSYEQAKIEEARDTPGLRVVEPPVVPVQPNPRGTLKGILLGFVLGFLIRALWILWLTYLDGVAERDPAQVGDFRRTLRTTLRDFFQPWRLFARRT